MRSSSGTEGRKLRIQTETWQAETESGWAVAREGFGGCVGVPGGKDSNGLATGCRRRFFTKPDPRALLGYGDHDSVGHDFAGARVVGEATPG